MIFALAGLALFIRMKRILPSLLLQEGFMSFMVIVSFMVSCAVAFQKKQFETFIHNMERDHPIWFLLVHFHLNYLVTGAYVICRERWWPLWGDYASLLSSSDSSSANTTPGHSCLRHSDLQQPAEQNRTTSLQQKEKKTACQENMLDTH